MAALQADPAGESAVERLIVDPDLGGVQLQDFLVRQWPQADRPFLRKAIRDGEITVNRAMTHPQRRLSPGDMVELEFEEDDIPFRDEEAVDEPKNLEVLFENDQLLVVDKPADMHTTPDRGGKYRGVHGRLHDLRPDQDLRIVHRLDFGTSGCLVLAKGLEVSRALDLAFREGQVQKQYSALVEGMVRREEFEVRKAIGPDRRRPGKMRTVDEGSKGSRNAHSVVYRVEQFRDYALLRVEPRTGRTHQIRVHLRAVGHPIVGDPDYGTRRPFLLSRIKPNYKIRRGVEERPLLRRMFLHAERITVPAIDGGEPVTAVSPLPSELELVLAKLRRFAARVERR